MLSLWGDFFQLAPVRDSRLFTNKNALVESLWVKHFKMFELKEVMRQKEDKIFAELLNRMREGLSTDADQLLLNDCYQAPNPDELCIFAYNEPKDRHNKAVLRASEGAEISLPAHDILTNSYKDEAAKAKAFEKIALKPIQETGGLPHTLLLKAGMPVEITSNIDVNDGLCNGTDGVFKATTGVGKAMTLWIAFGLPSVGTTTRRLPATQAQQRANNLDAAWTPITLVTREVYASTGAVYFKRTQFPVVLACGRDSASLSRLHLQQRGRRPVQPFPPG